MELAWFLMLLYIGAGVVFYYQASKESNSDDFKDLHTYQHKRKQE